MSKKAKRGVFTPFFSAKKGDGFTAEDKEEAKEVSEEETEEASVSEKLAEAETKAGEYLQMAQRIQADFDNYRRRTQKENAEFKQFATADVISDVLSVVDDFDRAIALAKEENEFVSGVKGIRYNLMKMLEARGVKEIPTDGKFDPEFHEAFCIVEGEEDGVIAEVFQKGYMLNGKVLRYSKVKVTKKKEQEPEEEAPAEPEEQEPTEEAPEDSVEQKPTEETPAEPEKQEPSEETPEGPEEQKEDQKQR